MDYDPQEAEAEPNVRHVVVKRKEPVLCGLECVAPDVHPGQEVVHLGLVHIERIAGPTHVTERDGSRAGTGPSCGCGRGRRHVPCSGNGVGDEKGMGVGIERAELECGKGIERNPRRILVRIGFDGDVERRRKCDLCACASTNSGGEDDG